MTTRLEYIEVDLNKCQLIYSVAPCAAELGVTGDDKCFNCRGTCQDLDNIDEAVEVVRYSKPSTLARFDLNAIPNITVPNIKSVKYAPPELRLGQSIGVRASITVVFTDHRSPDTDNSGDDYLQDRNYDPYNQGTYWGKFRARYPSLKGQVLRWIVGTSEQNISDMETRHFVIDRVTGPNANGTYTITAKDVLRLADGDQSVAPEISDKQLDNAINDTFTGTIVTVDDTDPLATEAPGYLAMGGKEIASYTATGSGPTSINITARGQLNTEAVSHDVDDSVQRVLEYDGEIPSDILNDLLVNYASVDPSFIPLDDWHTEDETYINRAYTTYIAEPTPVDDLVNELLEQTASTMWWDNRAQLIRWQVLRKPSTSAFTYDDDSTLKGSFNIADNYNSRVSRVYIYFGQINPLLRLDNLDNYTTRVLRTEIESEKLFNNVPSYKKITSRWIPSVARNTAERLGDLILQRFSLPPRKLGFRLQRDSGVEVPELGGAYNISNLFLQSSTGLVDSIPIQVTGLVPSNTTYTIKSEEVTFNEVITPEDPAIFYITIDVNRDNVNIRDLFDDIAPDPESGDTVNVSIGNGVIVGSVSTGIPALVSGDWPAGVTINLTNNGYIVGRGGNGGNGGVIVNCQFLLTKITSTSIPDTTVNSLSYTNPGNGGTGGDAIEVTYDINLTNNGTIGSGGGGGAGSIIGAGNVTDTSFVIENFNVKAFEYIAYLGYASGYGGGGGAGSVSGSGGTAGAVNNVSVIYNTQSAFVGDALLPAYNTASSATAGTLQNGGNGSGVGFTQTTVTMDPDRPPGYAGSTSFAHIVSSISSSEGGDLGQAGQGASSSDLDTDPNTGTYIYYSSGTTEQSYKVELEKRGTIATGGAAGDAIIQNGNTVNILVAGTILGAII